MLKPLQQNYKQTFRWLTQKQLETHGCILITVATDALVIKHQAIGIHSADWIFIVLDQLHAEILNS